MSAKQTVIHPTCPECSGEILVRDKERGETICCNCGLVVLDKTLSHNPEWKAFTPEERKARERVGAPTKYSHFDKGLSTVIRIGKDASGRSLSPGVRRQMWRLRRWHNRSKVYESQSKNLMVAMDVLDRLSEKLHIPLPVQEMAAVIYRKALAKGLVRGRTIAGVAAGALYVACRFNKTPRALREISEVSLRDRKEISRAYSIIVRTLDIQMPIDDPIHYVTKIAEKAGTSSNVEGRAIEIIRKAKNNHAAMGKDPSGLAAAALYIASKLEKEKIFQRHLAKASDVSEVTIRNRKRELEKKLNLNSSYRGKH